MYISKLWARLGLRKTAHSLQEDDFWPRKSYTAQIQSTLVISNSKGLTETLRDIRTSTYQSWESEENNKLNNHI